MSIWIMSANASYFDHDQAFSEQGFIDWKQTRNYSNNDIVLIYSTKPTSKIKYITKVAKTDSSLFEIANQERYQKKVSVQNNRTNRYCRLKLIKKVDDERLSFTELQKHGMIYVPQSPCKVSEPLMNYINSIVRLEDEKETN